MSHPPPQVDPVSYVSLPSPGLSIAFHQPGSGNDSGWLCVGDTRGSLQMWNLRSWRCDQTIQAFDQDVSVPWLDFFPLQKDDGTVSTFLLAQSRLSRKPLKLFCQDNSGAWAEEEDVTSSIDYTFHEGFCSASAFTDSASSVLLALPSRQADIIIARLSLKGFQIISTLEADTFAKDCGLVTALKFVPLGEDGESRLLLLAAYESGKLVLFDWANASKVSELDLSPLSPLALDFDASVMKGVAAGSEDYVVSFALDCHGNELSEVCKRTMPTKGVSDVAIRQPDRKIVIASCWDKTVRLFSWKKPEKLKPLGALKFHTDTVEGIACSKEPVTSKGSDKLIAAVSKDKKVSFWNVYN